MAVLRPLSSPELAALSDARWTAVRAPEDASRAEPRAFGEPADLRARLDDMYPEAGVLEVRGARVLMPETWIVTGDRWLVDHSWYAGHAEEASAREEDVPVVDVPGTTLFLTSDWAVGNYGHFLMDALPRLELFHQAGYDLADVDQVIGWDHPLARHLGLTNFLPDRPVAYRAERLIAPSFPGSRRNIPRWAVEFLRGAFSAEPRGVRRRLYLPRSTMRRVANEAEIARVLERFGFERFDPGARGEDPRGAFAAAEIVVGAHGAALTDIVFCPSDAKVLELLPSDHVYPYYFAAADSSGLTYGYLLGESLQHREPGALGPSVHDFRIDPELLDAALRELC